MGARGIAFASRHFFDNPNAESAAMPMTADEITRRIVAAIPDAEVTLEDLAGDNDHWKVTVKSPAFSGKTRVAQHRMVNAAFGADLGTVLHALSVVTVAA